MLFYIRAFFVIIDLAHQRRREWDMKKLVVALLVSVLILVNLQPCMASVDSAVEISTSFVSSTTDTQEISTIPDSNSFAVKVNMVNRGEADTLKIYLAGYNSEMKLADVSIIDLAMPANTTGTEEIVPLTASDDANVYKLFVWDAEFVPYTENIAIERPLWTDWSDWYDYDFCSVADAETEPTITVTGASVRIPDTQALADTRFKMTVNTPTAESAEIIEQGAAIVPFYAIGENDFTLETANVTKIANNEISTLGDNSYEFVTTMTEIPVHKYRAPVCVKGYVTYLVDGAQKTAYSEIAIYDVYSLAEEIIASDAETDAAKAMVQKFIINRYNTYIQTANTGDTEMLSVSSPASNEVVYPYKDYAKEYLLAGENLPEGEYESVIYYGPFGEFDVAKSIDITWTSKYEDVETFTVAYATKQDFSDVKVAYAQGNANKVSLYNLYKASDYYVKVIANLENGTSYAVGSTFKTADLGPRQIHLDGSANARDIGGYMTSSGERTLQGLIYRSGQMDKTYLETDTSLSAYGKYTAQRELGIVTDLDFRGNEISPIPGATHMFVGLSGYNLVSSGNKNKIRDTFKIFANINNYPLVFHCTGGADRTGTVAYLLNALLGVSERDLIRDYEWTSYSIYSLRYITSTSYIAKPDYKFFETLNAQNGDTLQEKVENYLLSCGVTSDEIANIKSIMFTGETPRTITVPEEFKLAEEVELKIKIGGSIDEISSVYIEDNQVRWKKAEDGFISISASEFITSVSDGNVRITVVFNDGENFSDTFDFDSTRNIIVCDEVSKMFDIPLTITVGAMPDTIAEVQVNGEKVAYTMDEHVATVAFEDIPSSVQAGEITVTVVFKDGAEISGTTSYDPTELCCIEDYMDATTLNASKTKATSAEVGYGKWVRIRMDATNDTNGNYAVFIGSYGAKFRGGETRYHTLDASGTIGLDARPKHYDIRHSTFQNGNTVYLYMKVDLVDNTAFCITLRAVSRSTGQILCEQSYTGTRIANEMATAPVTFVIDGTATSQLIIYGKE